MQLPRIDLLIGCLSALALGWGTRATTPEPTPALDRMASACVDWLDSLTAKQRDQASFALDAPDRQRWSNLPVAMFERSGVSLAEMNAAQRLAAHRLMQSALSEQGYARAIGIMQIDDVLAQLIPEAKNGYSAEHYWFSVFGDPESDDWGWQLDGHHLALNFTVNGERLQATPMFLGINPAEVQAGPYAGLRVLGALEDQMHMALGSLKDTQREEARLAAESPGDVLAGPGKGGKVSKEQAGLELASAGADQRAAALAAMHSYRDTVHPALRDALGDVGDEWTKQLHFGWAQAGADQALYMRMHSSRAWLEWSEVNGVGRGRHGVNHVHAVWRDPAGDYGVAIAAEPSSRK